MGNTRDDMTRTGSRMVRSQRDQANWSGAGGETSSSPRDEELPIIIEGEDRPIVVEPEAEWSSAGPAPDNAPPAFYADKEPPVFADEAEPATPTMPHRALRNTMPHTAARQAVRPATSSRRKRFLMAVGCILAVAAVAGLFYRSFGRGIAGGGQTATPVAQAPTATATPAIPAGTVSGPLILLNNGVVRQGSRLNVMGTGFAAGATVNLAIKSQVTGKALTSATVQANSTGSFAGAPLTVPTTLSSGSFTVEARQQGSPLVAKAIGTVAGGAPQVKLASMIGKPGQVIGLSVAGFSPYETINVYWNSMGGQPITTLQADSAGAVGESAVRVPYGMVGTNTFLFVGMRSQSLAAAPILLLSLYPSATLTSYAIRADDYLSFNGKGFGPGERVFVFLNSMDSPPVSIIQSNENGAFAHAGGFLVPFTLKGKQAVILMGEQSRRTSTVNFKVLPYAPSVQPSSYGGSPGTTISFFASGFARNEVVHVYVGGTQGNAGTMVGCFRTDDRGNGEAIGTYLIPSSAQGALTFALTGTKSGSTATTTLKISPAPGPVNVPQQPPFTCSLDGSGG